MTLSVEIEAAIEELKRAFGDRVAVEERSSDGAVVRIGGIDLNESWSAPRGDLWFLIPYHYPDAAIYPYHVTGATRTGSTVAGLQPVEWRGMAATQVSLRHNGWNASVDTALGSALQTQAWLRTH